MSSLPSTEPLPLNWRGDPNTPQAQYARKLRAWHAAHEGASRRLPIEHLQRRVEAMQAMGWSYNDIASEMGVLRQALCKKVKHDKYVNRAYLARADAVYQRLAYCRPVKDNPQEQGVARRNARVARSRGYAPALAWDNIDNLNERPKGIRRGNAADNRLRTPGRLSG